MKVTMLFEERPLAPREATVWRVSCTSSDASDDGLKPKETEMLRESLFVLVPPAKVCPSAERAADHRAEGVYCRESCVILLEEAGKESDSIAPVAWVAPLNDRDRVREG